VRVVAETGMRYVRSEILAAFPPIEKPSHTNNSHATWRSAGEEAERIRDALRAIPSDDRGVWLRIGMSLKSELGDGGFALWREWSQSSIKFDQEDSQTGVAIDQARGRRDDCNALCPRTRSWLAIREGTPQWRGGPRSRRG